MLWITAGIYAQTYLQCVTQAGRLCAERQTHSNGPTDLFQFETLALHSGDYSCYGLVALQTLHSSYRSPLSRNLITLTEINVFLSASKQNKQKRLSKTNLGCFFNKAVMHIIQSFPILYLPRDADGGSYLDHKM